MRICEEFERRAYSHNGQAACGYESMLTGAELGHAIGNIDVTVLQTVDCDIPANASDMIEFSAIINPSKLHASTSVSPVFRYTHYLDIVINQEEEHMCTKYLVGHHIPFIVGEESDKAWQKLIEGEENTVQGGLGSAPMQMLMGRGGGGLGAGVQPGGNFMSSMHNNSPTNNKVEVIPALTNAVGVGAAQNRETKGYVMGNRVDMDSTGNGYSDPAYGLLEMRARNEALDRQRIAIIIETITEIGSICCDDLQRLLQGVFGLDLDSIGSKEQILRKAGRFVTDKEKVEKMLERMEIFKLSREEIKRLMGVPKEEL